jgi:predicted enzyme related to lactoylglutathione lyase
MATSSAPGRFVWYDLLTTDRKQAAAFYEKLFGWTITEQHYEGFGTYLMISAGKVGIGGLVPIKPAGPIPPHWAAYVSHPDPDAACRRAKELGGQVLKEGTDIPGVGRFAAISDGSTAYLMPFRFDGDQPPEEEGLPGVGLFCWNELMTDDVEKARDFYTGIFGWDTSRMDMSPTEPYHMFMRGSTQVAGLMKRPGSMPAPPSWLYYVHVEDVDRSFAKAKELGAGVCVEPTNIPNIGRFAVLLDPTKAAFAIFSASRG